jgi:glycosyltransferase involved in cell wall biosynthesis
VLPQLLALRDAGFDVTGISAAGPRVGELEALGIRHIAWTKATRAWDPRGDAAAFLQLITILRRERFDLVHTHNPKPGVLGRIAARVAGVPRIVNTVHGFYATREDPVGRRAAVLSAEWIAARCSDLELYQSSEDLAWATERHIMRRGHASYLGNGVDLTQFRPGRGSEEPVRKLRAELEIGEDELVVGAVGRMVMEKGWGEFFEAARLIREPCPRARFLAVGEPDGDKPDALSREMLQRHGGEIVFAGWRDDIADLMALMDVFVLASWREGLPRSAIEAAATGVPLVLTDIRGCREVVRDGIEGSLVPVRDAAALARAIVALLEDPQLRHRMGRAARARAEERFDEERVTRTVVGASAALLGGRR